MAVTINYPHSFATIIKNISGQRLDIPWLGRRGVIFRPDDTVALVGYTPYMPADLNRYDGKKVTVQLHRMIADGKLEVLSVPGGNKEMDNTSVPIYDGSGALLPGCRIEF